MVAELNGARRHWVVLRVTAVALVPLLGWFLWSLAGMARVDYPTVHEWLARRENGSLMIVLVATLFFHARLGLDEVIGDYLKGTLRDRVRRVARILTGLLALVAALAVIQVGRGG
ncbi:hypothetical protein JCM17961_19930 [Endothiovibrio diazotrophicus]